MSEAGEALGGRLKAERERKGFSTQKAADQLHLDAWVIEALESGDYARIGPLVYGKGHLKRYAELVGLPADDIIGAFETRPAAPAEAAPALRMRSAETKDRAPPWATVAGVAVISALVAAASVLWLRPWRTRHTAATAPQSSVMAGAPGVGASGVGAPKAAGSDSAASPADGRSAERRPADGGTADRVVGSGSPIEGTVPGGAHGASAAAGTTVASVAAGGTQPVAGVGHARLRLSFSADSWVDVHDASGHRLFAGRGRANSVRTIAGAAPMRIYLGFASGVQLEVNNRVVAIGPQFIAGDVAHFEAGADGVLRRDVHATAVGDPHPRG
jgi:cytoskeleton protein RodZ